MLNASASDKAVVTSCYVPVATLTGLHRPLMKFCHLKRQHHHHQHHHLPNAQHPPPSACAFAIACRSSPNNNQHTSYVRLLPAITAPCAHHYNTHHQISSLSLLAEVTAVIPAHSDLESTPSPWTRSPRVCRRAMARPWWYPAIASLTSNLTWTGSTFRSQTSTVPSSQKTCHKIPVAWQRSRSGCATGLEIVRFTFKVAIQKGSDSSSKS